MPVNNSLIIDMFRDKIYVLKMDWEIANYGNC